MKTSVNSETWIRVGSSMPITASDDPFMAITAVSQIATIMTAVPCKALVVAASSAQITNAAHITKPNHEELSTSAAMTAMTASAIGTLRWGRKYLRSCSHEISVK